MDYTIPLKMLSIKDSPIVGGKNASLGEMIKHLTEVGVRVPRGFATTTRAYQEFLAQAGLAQKIAGSLDTLDINDVSALQTVGEQIRQWIIETPFTPRFKTEITKAYTRLDKNMKLDVAIRSSATVEDLPNASFAGQQETFLHVSGLDEVLLGIKKVFASLFTNRAITYRAHHGFEHEKIAISAGVQRMVRSDLGASGVVFTLDTESGFDQVIFITAGYGLGETVVQGVINPDEFYVHKPTLRAGKFSIIRRNLGSKAQKMIYAHKKDSHDETVETVDVSEDERMQFCINDDEIIHLAKQALLIEEHYQRPMDIEWAKDGIDGEIFILQARPETVESRRSLNVIEQYQITEPGELITVGRSVGSRIGQGSAQVILDPTQMQAMQDGEVLVTDMTDPDWEPVMKRASAIVTNRGGRTCHAAIVARELGIPAVVGCGDATQKIQTGVELTVSCAEGETGNVYKGHLKYNVEKTEIEKMPELPFKLCMNLANPEQAFHYQFLPNDGIGLARLEFIINNTIGVHPNALLDYDKLPKEIKSQVDHKTRAYKSPVEYYIEKLREGISTISAAFYPKEVIVRFSDFKSNEYANLIGGQLYEPHEENPMIGFRGASRYIRESFHDCFALECEAIVRVRRDMGLTNTQIMLPFVRTVKEAADLIELLKSFNLIRKQHDLKIYMMCEIPSNAILAEAFLEHFDGFSIGSNDLTQLTLGLDRDSELIADLFDERNEAVKALLHRAISACRKAGKYVGICGQGPSDHPDLAKWLMNEGISSISLTPDTIVKTWLMLAKELQS